jgi:hypothetical protein
MARQMIHVLAHGLEDTTTDESRTKEGFDDGMHPAGSDAGEPATTPDPKPNERGG